MRPLPLLLVLCLVASVAGSWWLLGAEELPPGPAGGRAIDASVATDAEAPDAAAATLRTAAAGDGADAALAATDTDGDDATDATDAERVAAATGQQGAPRVRVVRGDPPAPVADAKVFFVLEGDVPARLGDNPRGLTRFDWPEAFGQRAVTDADGVALLPVAPAPWLCAAVAEGEFAFAVVPPRPRTHTLPLRRDEQVLLRATFADQQPAAGVPLAVLQHAGRDEARVIWQSTADAQGRAVARHFQLLRDDRRGPPEQERFVATAALPGAAAVLFGGRPAPLDEIALIVPPLGTLRVQLVDHRGTPLLSRATVGLAGPAPITLAALTPPLPLPAQLAAHRVDKPPGAAPVLLPWQPVATPVGVFARYPLERRPAESGPVAGPAEPGATVEVAVPLRDTQLVVAGALRFAGAEALQGVRVDGALWTAERELFQLAVDPVAEGRFDLVLGQRPEPEFWLELRTQQRSALSSDSTPTTIGARVRLPALRGRDRIELGTIELAELPALVTGVVVDDEGQPVADADVHVQLEEPEAQRGREPWRTLALHRTRSAADGAFRIDGAWLPGKLRVRADSNLHFADSVALHTPGQDVRIRIDRNGILRGRVLLPDWLPDGTASLQLRPFDPALRERDTRAVDLARRGGGRFVIEPLRPGRFDALVLVRNLPEPLVVLQDVFVVPGETRDQRLRPLDLRAALHRYRLRAVDAAGQPLALDGPILARVAKADGTVADAAFRWQKGRAELITPSPTAEMVFFGRGHRTVRVLLAAGEHDVSLPTTRPALVELPGLRALCGPTRKVRISAILEGDTGLPGSLGGIDQRSGQRFGFQRWDLGRTSGGWLGNGDVVEIPLLQSGKYRILLRAHATDTEKSAQGNIDLGVHELQIDSPSWTPVRVPVDALAVVQSLQQLDQQWAQQLAQQQLQERRGQPAPRGRGSR